MKLYKKRVFLAGQLGLGHLQITSPSFLTNFVPQTGQYLGNLTSFSPPVLSSGKTLTTAGITSPALSTITVSPIFKPNLLICSSL